MTGIARHFRDHAGLRPASIVTAVASLLIRAAHEPVRYTAMVLAVAALAVLIVYPLTMLFGFSLVDQSGQLSLRNFAVTFDQRGIVAATVNTAILAIYVPAGCVLIAAPMAWLVSRTDMPGKALVRVFVAIAFIIPSFITVISWVYLAAPNSGQVNKLLVKLLGLSAPPFNIFSFGGLVFVEIAHYYPLVFFLVAAALENIDSSSEDAARILGAGRLRVATTIVFPLVLPALLSGAILCTLDAIASFGAPAVIGTAANFDVLTTKIFQLMLYPPKLELAATIAMPIILFTIIALAAQRLLLGRRRFATLGGKSGTSRPVELGRLRWGAFAACALICIVTVLLPVGALVVLSLLTTFGVELKFSNLVISNYEVFFDRTFGIIDATRNGLLLSFFSATLCVLLGIVLVWIVERTAIRGRGLITLVTMITFGFPSIALGLGVFFAFYGWLFGTMWILLIAYVSKHIPYAFVALRNAIKQIGEELEESARISGAGWARTMKDVTVPLMRSGLSVSWILIFAICLRELTMSSLLSSTGTEVMAIKVMNYITDGQLEIAAAVAVVITMISTGAVVLARAVAGKGVMSMK